MVLWEGAQINCYKLSVQFLRKNAEKFSTNFSQNPFFLVRMPLLIGKTSSGGITSNKFKLICCTAVHWSAGVRQTGSNPVGHGSAVSVKRHSKPVRHGGAD